MRRPRLAWLKTDERFADPWGRARNKDALVDELDKIFKTRPTRRVARAAGKADVPHAPVLDYAGMAEHPQYWANGYLQEIETEHLGTMRVPGIPIQMSETPPRIQGAGPILGRDTEDILLEHRLHVGRDRAAEGRRGHEHLGRDCVDLTPAPENLERGAHSHQRWCQFWQFPLPLGEG